MAFYAHFSSASDSSQAIVESVKFAYDSKLITFDQIKQQILEYLTVERNDGNKTYSVEDISTIDGVFDDKTELKNGDDLFVSVKVAIDP